MMTAGQYGVQANAPELDPELLVAVMDHVPIGIIVTDEYGVIRSFNRSAEKLFGYAASEMLGDNVGTLIPELGREGHPGILERCLRAGEPDGSGTGSEVTGLHKDGSPIDMDFTVTQMSYSNGVRCLVGFASDSSARKRAEHTARERLAQLAHVNRLNTVSEIATGLAHELLQPLSAIRLTTAAGLALLGRSPPDAPELSSCLQQIDFQAKHASELIEQLRGFVRRDQSDQRAIHSVDILLRDVLSLLAHELDRADIQLFVDLAQPLCHCRVNPLHIEQVIFNLVKNAIDAMAGNVGDRRLWIRSSPSVDGSHCMIHVRDNGPGIPEPDLPRLFDPFFTTREQGLGQGLSICRSILQEQGCDLRARNHPEGGAEFIFSLPIANDGGN